MRLCHKIIAAKKLLAAAKRNANKSGMAGTQWQAIEIERERLYAWLLDERTKNENTQATIRATIKTLRKVKP